MLSVACSFSSSSFSSPSPSACFFPLFNFTFLCGGGGGGSLADFRCRHGNTCNDEWLSRNAGSSDTNARRVAVHGLKRAGDVRAPAARSSQRAKTPRCSNYRLAAGDRASRALSSCHFVEANPSLGHSLSLNVLNALPPPARMLSNVANRSTLKNCSVEPVRGAPEEA